MGTFSDLKAQFDSVNKKRKGDQFEFVCKWFLENDPTQYKQLLRRVWLWKDWPGNWGIDAGIDLVAEDAEGRLWAVQAKAYEGTVTRSEVNKFLAEASRFNFAYRMLIATTDQLSPTAQRTMEDLGVTFIGLTELEEFDDWPAKLTDLRPAKPPKPKNPWDYQRAAIKDVVKGFQSADRGQLIMACGTGKTLTAWFIKEKLAAERTLVLVPSLSLLKQTIKEWRTANINRPFDSLPVCSDETVGQDEDAAISHTSYLGEPADTDPEVIAAFLRKRSGPRVVFSTYQSSPQIAKALALDDVPEFDLVIADEAHRVAGAMSSDFATVLNPAAIRAKRRLFMTATPRYYTGRVIRQAKEDEDEIASMDDRSKFGEVFHRLGFGEAIERRLLTDYQVAIIDVDDATYRDWAERGKLMTLNGKKTDARSLAGQIGLAKAMRKYDLRRVISFHGRVNRARSFAASMPEVIDWMPARQRPKGSLWAAYASGEMSAGQRHNLLQQLKRLDDNERGILANARCLAEGVDVPTLDGVAFIDPRRSEVDIVQAVGRAIRKSDTKSIGTIVIPVFIDTQEDPEVALDDSVFKPVWDVIKALRAHDDELGNELDELRRELGRQKGRLKLPSKIRHDLSPSVSAEFASAFDVRLVEQTTASWEFWVGLLERYQAENEHCLVPVKTRQDGHKLGAWVNEQRTQYVKGTLSAERVSRLADIEGWTWDARDTAWEDAYKLLQEYVAKNGSALVPTAFKTASGFKLGQWVGLQRLAHEKTTLAGERREKLEAIDGWCWDRNDYLWEEGFRHLAEYVQTHGGALVPLKYKSDDGYGLGGWVNSQKVRYGKGTLTAEREQRLLGLPGWSWSAKDTSWDEGYSRLLRYIEIHHHADVPQTYVEPDGYRLGSWVTVQRTARNVGRLKAEREEGLAKLPGWVWGLRDTKWEKAYAHLLRYVEEFHTAAVPQGYIDDTGFNLGGWAATQRGRRKQGALASDREQRLDVLPGWTWGVSFESEWDETLQRLLEYVEVHGDARVPSSYVVDGCRLGVWVAKQRIKWRKGSLETDRERKLEGVEGWTWDPLADDWEEAFQLLLDYVELHGDAHVHQHYITEAGFRLGKWVAHQRSSIRRGALEADRERRLLELPGFM